MVDLLKASMRDNFISIEKIINKYEPVSNFV